MRRWTGGRDTGLGGQRARARARIPSRTQLPEIQLLTIRGRAYQAALVVAAAVGLLWAAAARADLVRDEVLLIDQQPTHAGGFGSDTEFRDNGGNPVWQRIADDIALGQSAWIGRIVWWGFYGGTFDEVPEPAPDEETMRIRFYHARPTDGLPDEGSILFEESFLNPSRTATGEIIGTGPAPPEYVYEVSLPTPVLLEADTPYWMEIVQIGDLESLYRWEVGYGPRNGVACVNAVYPNWTHIGINADKAHQLWAVPEPATALMVAIAAMLLGRRRKHQKGGVGGHGSIHT